MFLKIIVYRFTWFTALVFSTIPTFTPLWITNFNPTQAQISDPIFTQIDLSTINRFEVRDNNTGITIVMTREITFDWFVSKLKLINVPSVDHARINDQLRSFTNLVMVDRFRNPDLTDYGLDMPDYTISITDLEGRTNTLYVGNHNPGATRFYVLVDDQIDIMLIQRADIDAILELITMPPYLPS